MGLLSPWMVKYSRVQFRPGGRSMAGVDCYGLVWLVYNDDFSVPIPAYEGEYSSSFDPVVPALLESGAQECWWRELRDTEPSVEGDVLVFRVRGAPGHVGVAMDNDWMLHIESGSNVLRERYRTIQWERRLVARYRHRDVENGRKSNEK